MNIIEPEHFVSDDRRTLLAAAGDVMAYSVVFEPGQYAGGHLHCVNSERVYVVVGPVAYQTEGEEGELISEFLEAGTGVSIPPYTPHKFYAPEDAHAVLLVVSDRSGEDDTKQVVM